MSGGRDVAEDPGTPRDRRTRGGAFRGLALVLALAIVPVPAAAQSADEVAGARAAATEGLKSYEAGRYAEAIDYFSRAESLVHAPPHLLFMARAHAAMGHLVQARELYIKLRTEEIPAGKPKAFFDAKLAADKELAQLEPKVPYVKVTVEGATPGAPLTVTMDGTKVPSALVGIARPVDPGRHEFSAAAPGWTTASESIDVAQGAHETVVLKMTASATGPMVSTSSSGAATTATTASPASSSGPIRDLPPPTHDAAGRGFGPWPWISLGAGAVGLGVGIAFAAVHGSARSQADDLCGGGVCPASRRADVEAHDRDANRAAVVSTVGFVAAAAFAIGGVSLLLLRRGGDERGADRRAVPSRADRPRVDAWIGWGVGGVRGTF